MSTSLEFFLTFMTLFIKSFERVDFVKISLTESDAIPSAKNLPDCVVKYKSSLLKIILNENKSENYL